MMKLKYLTIGFLFFLMPHLVRAEWRWALNYHNPHTTSYGLTAMHIWTDWAVEVGLGYIATENAADDTGGINLGAGFYGKYLFLQGLLRPFAQVGYGMSSGVIGDGAGAGTSGFLMGGGLYVWGSEFNVYLAYNFTSGSNVLQFGIGFPLSL